MFINIWISVLKSLLSHIPQINAKYASISHKYNFHVIKICLCLTPCTVSNWCSQLQYDTRQPYFPWHFHEKCKTGCQKVEKWREFYEKIVTKWSVTFFGSSLFFNRILEAVWLNNLPKRTPMCIYAVSYYQILNKTFPQCCSSMLIYL